MRVWMLPLGCALLVSQAFAQRIPEHFGRPGGGHSDDFGSAFQFLGVVFVLGCLAVLALHLLKIVANLFWLLLWVFSGRRTGNINRIKSDLGDSFKGVAGVAMFAVVIGGPIACYNIVNR